MTLNITADTHDVQHVAWIGPTAVLAAMLFSLATQQIWDRLVGEVTCMWRVSYAPDNRAFAIWAVLYPTTAIAVLLQWLALALPAELAVLGWWTSLGWAGAWLLAGLWIVAFDKEEGCNFWLSTLVLACAAASATTAVAVEGAWRLRPVRPVLRPAAIVTAAPLALLAGWLLVAFSLNVGIAIRSASSPQDCTPYRYRVRRILWLTDGQYQRRIRRSLYRQTVSQEAPLDGTLARLPLVLVAAAAAGLAFATYEPLLPLPVVWATVLQPGFRCCPRLVELASLALCIAGTALAAVRIALWDAAATAAAEQ